MFRWLQAWYFMRRSGSGIQPKFSDWVADKLIEYVFVFIKTGAERMKRLLFSISVTAGLLAAPLQADTLLGLYAGVDGWSMDSSGSFGTASSKMQDFDLGNDTKVSFFIALEHPIPVIPNIRLRTNNLSSSGDVSQYGFHLWRRDFFWF